MTLILNGQGVACFTNSDVCGQQIVQPMQSYIVPNYGYSNIGSMPQTHHVCVATSNYQTVVPLQQSEMRMYQMKQDQLRISQQRHAEEMYHTQSHPQIRHHCAIIDRLNKNDNRYTDFTNQVKINEQQFEADSDTFADKHHIASKMNAQRLSVLGSNSSTLSRNSSKESFVRTNGECADNVSDEETTGNVKNGYMSSPSSGSSASSNDALPPCNPGDSSPLVGCENNSNTRPLLTCLSLLGDQCGESHDNESDTNEANKEDNCDEDETFEVNYAWINEELEKLEVIEKEKKIKESWQRRVDFSTAPVVSLPIHMQMPVPMDASLPWVHANYALPMVAMPMIRYPYQTYVTNIATTSVAFNGSNVYTNEHLPFYA